MITIQGSDPTLQKMKLTLQQTVVFAAQQAQLQRINKTLVDVNSNTYIIKKSKINGKP